MSGVGCFLFAREISRAGEKTKKLLRMGNESFDVTINSKPATWVELLRSRALHQRDRLAFSFLADGTSGDFRITYGELDRKARSIAAALQSMDLFQAKALLLYPPGFEFIGAYLGCLYAGVVAVPANTPSGAHGRGLPRVQAVANDARPAVVLTVSSLLPLAERLREGTRAPWLATDDIAPDRAEAWNDPNVNAETLAFLQYTSGSTSLPKGVMLTHGNLLYNSALISECFGHTPESRGVIWLPPYHDMGLIGGVLQPLFAGFPCALMSPVAFLQRPFLWLQAISRFRATTSGGPDFAYDLCVRRISPEQRATLDLSTWDVAFNGAEPIRAQALERFAGAFESCGFRRAAFYPCYGLAESTLIVSGGDKRAPAMLRTFAAEPLARRRVVEAGAADSGARTLVGCGHAMRDHEIAIVDPDTRLRCAPGQVGEIWVSGPSVARGYWNRPEETAQMFQAQLADDGSGPYLRTGDLGFLHEGELFIAGRIKDLIIIAGRNVYPQDIENTVEQSHPSLRPGCGAAFSVSDDAQERLVVVHEVERHGTDLDGVSRAIRRAVAELHDVQVHSVVLLKTGQIPKTSSGKIQRHACRAAFLAGSLEPLRAQ